MTWSGPKAGAEQGRPKTWQLAFMKTSIGWSMVRDDKVAVPDMARRPRVRPRLPLALRRTMLKKREPAAPSAAEIGAHEPNPRAEHQNVNSIRSELGGLPPGPFMGAGQERLDTAREIRCRRPSAWHWNVFWCPGAELNPRHL